jgi:glutaminyl-peptide cyclotransferase
MCVTQCNNGAVVLLTRLILLAVCLISVDALKPNPKAALYMSYDLLDKVPHDSECFTQGLVNYEGRWYESCGLNGRSSVRIFDPATGAVLKRNPVPLPHEVFSEGIYVLPHADGPRL